MSLSVSHLRRCIKRLLSPSEDDSEQDLTREIQSHLDLQAEEARERGLSADEANYAALRKVGNTALIQEDVRATWGWAPLERFARDAGYGLRQIRHNPRFSAIAISRRGARGRIHTSRG